MKISTKYIAQVGLLLAICVGSQFMKSISVYITGPIVNLTIVMAVLMVGLGGGLIVAILSPLTAFLIAPSPIMMGIPLVIPCIIIGNVLLAVGIWVFHKKALQNKTKEEYRVLCGMLAGSIAKAAFMAVAIVLVLLPMYGGNIPVPAEKLPVILETAKVTFSVTQFITSILGCAFSYIIWLRIRPSVRQNKG